MTMTTATPPATPAPDLTADDALLVAAQLHPTAFVLAMKGGKYRPAWFHWRIGDALAAVAAGRCRRLMIFMPPQYGKSELVSRNFPPWHFGRHPERSIIATSYGADLAEGFGRDARHVIESPEYRAVFPGVQLARDAKAADHWAMAGHEGRYFAAGVGGPITGRGADVLIIDDPIKDVVEANSETTRAAIWDWYRMVAYPRVREDGAIVLIQTRWHEDDLAGRLLAEQANGGDRWRVLELPARGEDGAALWPEKHDRTALEQVERVVGPYAWQALYQQRPAPAEGGVLKDWWWRYWCWEGQEDRLPPVRVRTPEGEQLIRARQIPAGFDIELQSWDMAFKDTKSSAYVVGQVWGRERADFYLCDQVREKMDFVATQAAVRETTRLWPRALLKLVEDKANGPAIIASLNEEIAGFDAVEPRMQAVAPAIASGHVYIPHPAIAPWVPGFLAECAVAPYGRYMDQVDTMSQALDRLAHSALGAPVDRHGSIPIVSARALARGERGVRRR
jgi:predicted phage terminase large subunit-like protein